LHVRPFVIARPGSRRNAVHETLTINSAGTIVGVSYITGNTAQHAFSYSGGVMTNLGTLGGTFSTALGINTGGTIVGYSNITGNSTQHAFSYSAGVMSDLGTLGGTFSTAVGINSAGTIVG
jgi:probable HAF family extracellular repeat protein